MRQEKRDYYKWQYKIHKRIKANEGKDNAYIFDNVHYVVFCRRMLNRLYMMIRLNISKYDY